MFLVVIHIFERFPAVLSDSVKKPSSLLFVRALLVLLFVIWSNAFTAIKHLREILSPGELVLARFLPAAIGRAVSRRLRKTNEDLITLFEALVGEVGESGHLEEAAE